MGDNEGVRRPTIEIREARLDDLAEIVALHCTNYSANDFSMILGPYFIKAFYRQIIETPSSLMSLVVVEGHIAALSVSFSAYGDFETKFQKNIRWILLSSLAGMVLTLRFRRLVLVGKIIWCSLRKDTSNLSSYDQHLGSIIVDKTYRGDMRVFDAFYRVLVNNMNQLVDTYGSCWGSCRVGNSPVVQLLKSLHFKELGQWRSYPEDIVVFERTKKRRMHV